MLLPQPSGIERVPDFPVRASGATVLQARPTRGEKQAVGRRVFTITAEDDGQHGLVARRRAVVWLTGYCNKIANGPRAADVSRRANGCFESIPAVKGIW
jgi:hypothetical protein